MTKVSRAVVALALCLTLSVGLALAFESVFDITIRPRQPDPLDASANRVASAEAERPLPLRLVDSGGVGMPLSPDWGADYSHARRVFHEAILLEPPYIDDAVFARIEQEWRAYVDRMIGYGNNAITVPLFLELIDFDRVVPPRASDATAVYEPDSHFRLRIDELFDTVPGLDGIVLRFGEGGSLYNVAGWPYRSQVGIRTAADLRTMVRSLFGHPSGDGRRPRLVVESRGDGSPDCDNRPGRGR